MSHQILKVPTQKVSPPPKKNLFYFFDGTGVNINSSVERKFGCSVIGELYTLNSSTAIPTSFSPPHPSFTDLWKAENIKFYFPGPGAESAKLDTFKFRPPGKEQISQQLEKTSLFSLINQIYGHGWQHNELKALYFACYLSNDSRPDCHFVLGYSRGGITAISFSKKLSELKPNNKIYLYLIDPVAGLNFSKLENPDNLYSSFISNEGILPYVVGKRVEHAKLFYATLEDRTVFKPQMPALHSERYQNNSRPLYFLEETSADIYFMSSNHQQIAYRLLQSIPQASGQRVFYEIANDINAKIMNPSPRPIQNITPMYSTSEILYCTRTYEEPTRSIPDRLIFTIKKREIYNEVHSGCRKETYRKGELFKLKKLDYTKLKEANFRPDLYG